MILRVVGAIGGAAWWSWWVVLRQAVARRATIQITEPFMALSPRLSPRYGGRGRPWHPAFIEYAKFIAAHPAYRGMPDAYSEPGRVQWEAPSNRKSGRFKDTHELRRRWWERKAQAIGISTAEANWISKVAKRIHPTGSKPCKICGRVMELRYAYPGMALAARVSRAPFVDPAFRLERTERITDLVTRLHLEYGSDALAALPGILGTRAIPAPEPLPGSLRAWLAWIEDELIPAEPRGVLSPGAMSNAPDRFDGFHCDNLCCRRTADTGRHPANMSTYATDRRVSEYWASGDWVAANRLMGQIRTRFKREPCRNGHPGPCDADHVGPISLGFSHRPRFQLLCGACNSGKNNRMTLSDVSLLLRDEADGQHVISWHARALWDRCKRLVTSDEMARRLCKLLRDNRHTLMFAVRSIAEAGHYTFLTALLELEHADRAVVFEGLRIERHVTEFDALSATPLVTTYATKKKAYRCRVAFTELLHYFQKGNRNAFVVSTPRTVALLESVLRCLNQSEPPVASLDRDLARTCRGDERTMDTAFRALMPRIAAAPRFGRARAALQAYTDAVGAELASHWSDERYVRAARDED